MWGCLVIGIMCISVCFGSLSEYILIRDLLDKYDINVRPAANASLPVVVSIDLNLEKLLDVDDRNQIIKIRVWSSMTWRDHHLKWNPTNYSGVTKVHIRPDRIWTPDITLYSEVSYDTGSSLNRFLIKVQHDGLARWAYPVTYHSACALDMTYFPWDYQICNFKFGSWTYDQAMVDLVNETDQGSIIYLKPDGEWDILGCPLRRNVVSYKSIIEGNVEMNNFVDVTFFVILRRQVLYYAYNLLLPAIVITTTTLLVFYLPPESGEKVNLAITVLLALTVFLLTVSNTMPVQSDVIPLIGQYFGAQIILMSLSTSMAVVVLNVHYRSRFNVRVPPLVKVLVLHHLATVLCMRGSIKTILEQHSQPYNKGKDRRILYQLEDKTADNQITTPPLPSTNGNIEKNKTNVANPRGKPEHRRLTEIYQDICDKLKDIYNHILKSNVPNNAISVEWVLVARVLDRLFLVGFFVGTLIVSTAIMCRQPPPLDVDEMIERLTKP